MNPSTHDQAVAESTLQISPSAEFGQWLHQTGTSLTFTTYQAGKIFMIGAHEDTRLSIFERTLDRCMGLCTSPSTILVAGRHQIYRFENALADGEIAPGGHDRHYLPQLSYFTGDLDVHDLLVDGTGQVMFANTLFNCVATVSASHSFKPVWKPPFIRGLAAGDKCHLNGLAVRDGALRYVSVTGVTDQADGWRDQKLDGGAVLDVRDNSFVARGLSMPHSPRWYRDRLWLHDSGTGRFGFIDLDRGVFEAVAFCPGYLRGMCFIGDHAVISLSKPRGSDAYDGLVLQHILDERNLTARCGLYVINLETGRIDHRLLMDNIVDEIYDVCVLPGARRPSMTGFRNDDINRMITIDI